MQFLSRVLDDPHAGYCGCCANCIGKPLLPETVKPAASVYEAILPLLLRAMEDWRSPKELAEELKVRKPQLDDWLKRAMDKNMVEKKSRPVLYRRISQDEL